MAKNKKNRRKTDPYSEEVIKSRRTFPRFNTVLLVICLIVQLGMISFALIYDPKPQDRIDKYEVTAEPLADGSLDIEYRFVWTPLDTDEDLTWVEIGMPNPAFSFYISSFSENISTYEKYADEYYVSSRLYLDRPYRAGETLTFSFKVNQRDMLCKDENGYFYEFIPGWFNSTPVESYSFMWKDSEKPIFANTNARQNGFPIWEGSLPIGECVKMQISYAPDAFTAVSTVKYEEFDDSSAYNELQENKVSLVIFAVILSAAILALQIYLIDSVVSYHRGRGFLTGYGHHIHIYGRTNPRYESEKDKHSSSGGRGGRGGGGCACACACACAGGGRAGCSQKDTTQIHRKKK